MKEKILLWMILLAFAFFCGCTHQAQSKPTGTETQSATAQTQPEIIETFPVDTADEEKYPDVVECGAAEGFVTPESAARNTPCHVLLTKQRDDADSAAKYVYDLYIEIDTGAKVLKKELESQVSTLPADSLFLSDVDGDGVQDILIHNNTGGCGGFGLWRTWVLKVENDEICILFKNFNEYDTGFESRFLDGYQLEVKNRITDYSLVVDVKEAYRTYIANSAKLPDGNMELDPFYFFEPEDVDDDGISEVVCKQYTYILSHADYTGSACSVLKFNNQMQAFEVIDAWYEPNIEE